MLRVDPARRPRLEELHDNLIQRLDEARRMRWHGEIDGIEQSLTHLARKLEQLDRAGGASLALLPARKPDSEQ